MCPPGSTTLQRRLDMQWPVAAVLLATVAHAAPDCFITDEWNLVRGKPSVLLWQDGKGWWDVLLSSDVLSQPEPAGIIARNITQHALVWVPPLDIAIGEPHKWFAVQLWNLGTGSICSSPAFRFPDGGETSAEAEPLPSEPLVTTIASFESHNPATVTATVAHFSNGVNASYSSTIPTGTAPGSPADGGGGGGGGGGVLRDQSTAIVLGAVFGTLLVALVILSVLLWRAKRKKARRGTLDKGKTPYDRIGTPSEPSALVLGELDVDSSAAPATPGQNDSRCELHAPEKTHEMEAPPTPVELPAEVPPIRLYNPERGHSFVSAMTTDSPRSSAEIRPVSPSTVHVHRLSVFENLS